MSKSNEPPEVRNKRLSEINELSEAKIKEATSAVNELSEVKIQKTLNTESIGRKIILLSEVDSTNRYAKAIAKKEIDGCDKKNGGCSKESIDCGKDTNGCNKETDGCRKETDGYNKESIDCGKVIDGYSKETDGCGKVISGCEKGIDGYYKKSIGCGKDIDGSGEKIDGCVVIAKSQQAGYGRDGQQWFTGSGNDIAMSAIVRFDDDAQKLGDLAMLVSLAVRRAISKICDVEAAIKWPNDLMIDGKKCCGILCETASSGNKICYIIIGIGLNVNSTQFDEAIDHRACSLQQACGREIDLNKLAASILNELERILYGAWRRNERSALHEEYQRFSNLVGKEIKIVRKKQGFGISVEAHGTVLGFDPDGSIRLQLQDGSIKRIYSGELSLIE